MSHVKRTILIVLITFLIPAILHAADQNYPYSQVRIKLPPAQDPFPGFGSYYSTISKGMKSALWNPASLGKLKLSEVSLATISVQGTKDYQKTYELNETSATFESTDGGSGGQYALFYRYPTAIGSGISTTKINVITHSNYATATTGTNFNSALKINDWLTVGFASNSPIAAETNIAGDFPITGRADTNLYGRTLDKMRISTTGKLTYTFTGSGGSVTTYESTQGLWSGFVSQEVTIPLTTLTESRNNVNVQSPFMGTISSNFGNIFVGLNLIPITATANLNTDLHATVNSDADDQFVYVPDFDTTDQADLANWINDPDQYNTQAGYKRKQINIPAGEIIGTGKYRGLYSASATRFDLGAIYDVNEWFTIGLALENINSSSLNFKGESIATYLNYRDINTAEAGNLDELLSPGGKTTYDLLTNRWVTTNEVNNTKLYLEPEKNYALPKRVRFGLAVTKPFLIALDFEQNQSTVTLVGTENNQRKEYTVSNINLIRLGLESQLFVLPMWLRSGLTLLAKPNISGLDAASEKSFNNAFQYGYFPVKFDLGGEINFWGSIVGSSLGVSVLNIINLLQFDTTDIDLSKSAYGNVYLTKGPWQISYLALLDPVLTGATYAGRTVPAGQTKNFEVADLKFIHNIGLTYRF